MGKEIRKRGKTENTAPERRGSKFHYLKLSPLFLGWGFSSTLAYFTQFTNIYSISNSKKRTFYKGFDYDVHAASLFYIISFLQPVLRISEHQLVNEQINCLIVPFTAFLISLIFQQ